MKIKKNFTYDVELIDELKKISDRIGVAQSKILNEALAQGISEIKKLNYNYSKYVKERV